jgi:hypothetical protein
MNAGRFEIISCLAILVQASQLVCAVEPRSYPLNDHDYVVQRLDGDMEPARLPAEIQLVNETWQGDNVHVPYMAYMPEKDRVLLMMSLNKKSLLIHSDDRGKTWSNRQWLSVDKNGQPNARPGGLTYLGQGRLVATERNVLWSSADFGQTWTSSTIRPISKRHGDWNPLLVLKDAEGRVRHLARGAYEENGNPWGSAESPHSWAYFESSDDEGRTWSESTKVPAWRGVNEVAMIVARNGDWVAACRTDCPLRLASVAIGQRHPGKEDFDHDNEAHMKAHFATFGRRAGMAHWDHYCGLAISLSKDQGKTWSEPTTLYEWGRHHPSMVVLRDGRILMSYVVRLGYPDTADGFPQFGVEAALSADNGRTWDLDHHYVLAKWAGRIRGEHSYYGGVQSTATVVLPDRQLLTAFGTGARSMPDMRRKQDVALIRWRLDAP